MIGFPGIKKISYNNGVLTIEKEISNLNKNPNDSVALDNLENALNKTGDRPTTNPEVLYNMAKGFASIGDTVKALDRVDDIMKIDSGFSDVQEFKNKIDTKGARFERLAEEVMEKPDDQQARKLLEEKVHSMEESASPNNVTFKRLVMSSVALRDTARTLKYLDSLKPRTANEEKKIKKLRRQFSKKR